MSLSPQDKQAIRDILDEALRGGAKKRTVRVTGLLKVPGNVQYSMRHLSFSVEEELPGDKKRSDVVREICEDLGPLVLEMEPKPKPASATPNVAGTPNTSPTPIVPGAPPEPTPELDPAYLDGLPWTPFATGGGAWIFRDTPGAKALSEELDRVGGSTVIGAYRYKVTKGRDREFVNRFPEAGK